MSVTVIQSPDVTSDAFAAWKTIEDIKNRAKQAAIDQQLAQQHIQSAQTIDQLNKAKLQMEQQSAAEFTSPDAIARRKSSLDTELGQQSANLNSTLLSNDLREKTNPLMILQQEQASRSARIAADSAQQHLNLLVDQMPNAKDLGNMAVQAKRYELMQQGLDSHTAVLRSAVEGADLANKLQLIPQQGKLQQTAIQQALETLPEQPILNKIKTFGSVANQIGIPGAKAAMANLPGYEGFQNVPDDSMKVSSVEKDRELQMLIGLAKQGDADAQTVLGQRIAKGAGVKTDSNPLSSMIDPKTGKPYIQTMADPVVEAAQRVAKKFASLAKQDPTTGEYYIGDQSPKPFGTVPNAPQLQVQTGTQNLGSIPAGTSTTNVTPVAPASVQVQTGTQSLITNPTDKFAEMEDVIKRHKDVADQTYVANKAPDVQVKGKNESAGVDQLVSFPLDPEYTVMPDGRVFNSTKAATSLTQAQKTLGGFPKNDDAVDTNLSIKDPKFAQTSSQVIQQGFQDSTASAKQTARFSAVMSQLARGFNESGVDGLKNVYQVIRQKYPQRGDMTDVQIGAIKSLLGVYGIR